MKVIELRPEQFFEYIKNETNSNPWQTPWYGNILSKFNFSIDYIGFEEDGRLIGASLLLGKIVYMGFKHYYAPRGIITDYNDLRMLDLILKELQKYIFRKKGILLTIDPFVIKTIRNKNGVSIFENENCSSIINTICKNNFDYLENDPYFEGIQPRWHAEVDLPVNPTKLFGRLSKTIRNKLRKAAKFGVEIYQDETANIEELYKLIDHEPKRPIEYYKELKNNFGNNCEIYYARINTETYVENSKILYEKSMETIDQLNGAIQTNSYKGKNMRAILNKKMDTDKVVSSYKEHLVKSTQLLQKYPEGYTIAGCIVLKNNDDVYIYEEFYAKEFGSLCPLHMLKWKIIEKFARLNGKISLGPITGEFDKTKNNIIGLNNVKLDYSASAIEYIGEFTSIINKPLFTLYSSSGKKEFKI